MCNLCVMARPVAVPERRQRAMPRIRHRRLHQIKGPFAALLSFKCRSFLQFDNM